MWKRRECELNEKSLWATLSFSVNLKVSDVPSVLLSLLSPHLFAKLTVLCRFDKPPPEHLQVFELLLF